MSFKTKMYIFNISMILTRKENLAVGMTKKSLIFVLIYIVLYFRTFRRVSRLEYSIISILMIAGSLVFTLNQSCKVDTFIDGTFTYPFLFILIAIIFLPVNINISLPIILIFAVVFILIAARKMMASRFRQELSSNRLVAMKDTRYFFKYRIMIEGKAAYLDAGDTYLIISLGCSAMMIAVGCYLRFWNGLRRRSAFLIIWKSIRARQRSQKALGDQKAWINAIMPSQVIDQYIKLQKEVAEDDSKFWLYSKSFNKVSILFADIVGFTKMSSSKKPTKIVMLLNDLYNRFDDLAQQTNCEKIGTLGDCYYAVAGCPEFRNDHAVCLVEMGLGMCRIIKVFNFDNNEDVNMRVGIHTGRVNAAIIGQRRFRYDVYSFDVIVANKMESLGLPGRVHISETTYEEVKGLYKFAKGEDATIQREENVGISGLLLRTTVIQTYFVDPRSSKFRNPNEKFGMNIVNLRVLTVEGEQVEEEGANSSDTPRSSEEDSCDKYIDQELASNTSFDSKSSSTTISDTEYYKSRRFNKYVEKWRKLNEEGIHMVELAQNDPQHQMKLFSSLPLTPFLRKFENKLIEKEFIQFTESHAINVTIDSPKLTPLFDSIAIFISNSILTTMHLMQAISSGASISKIHIGLTVVDFFFISICTGLFIGTTITNTKTMKYSKLAKVYKTLRNAYVREMVLILMTLVPTFINLMLDTNFSKGKSRDASTELIYLEIAITQLCMSALIMSSFAWIRFINLVCLIGTILVRLYRLKPKFDLGFCDRTLWFQQSKIGIINYNERLIQTIGLFLILYTMALENEYNIRLWYYVYREAENSCLLAEKENNNANMLLDNVIPKYVFQLLHQSGHKNLTAGTFCYAANVEEVAVAFASITNFFTTYYREDYKGGESSLKLLNIIITTFDELMDKRDFCQVEKIKTINDCYMVAAGLNIIERNKYRKEYAHAYQLMDYCFELQRVLAEINDKYIIGSDQLTIKIGYNIGAVTAGIIGTTKPIYDIWGNAVNVASRMYSTGSIGKIQVPNNVKDLLNEAFNFEYRGTVFVKGKGDMQTYFCSE